MNAAYALRQSDVQMVEFTLNRGDKVLGTTEDMMYMENGINQDLSQDRLVEFVNDDFVQRKIAFGASSINKIVPIDLDSEKGGIYCMDEAFLCAAHGSEIRIRQGERRRLNNVTFCACGLQQISGEGTVFLSATGTVICRELEQGEILRVDASCMLAMSDQISYDYQIIGRGEEEGSCIVTVAGPGKMWLQTTSYGAGHIIDEGY